MTVRQFLRDLFVALAMLRRVPQQLYHCCVSRPDSILNGGVGLSSQLPFSP